MPDIQAALLFPLSYEWERGQGRGNFDTFDDGKHSGRKSKPTLIFPFITPTHYQQGEQFTGRPQLLLVAAPRNVLKR